MTNLRARFVHMLFGYYGSPLKNFPAMPLIYYPCYNKVYCLSKVLPIQRVSAVTEVLLYTLYIVVGKNVTWVASSNNDVKSNY